MRNISLEKPAAVFLYAPVIEDICIELGVDRTDAETVTCMYEVFKRMNGGERVEWDEDAYNEYTYQTYLYQQQMEEINAQTSVIQAQDKKLELRLKQLDTEQNAISTEIESLNSLIDKNVENSFKVFA